MKANLIKLITNIQILITLKCYFFNNFAAKF